MGMEIAEGIKEFIVANFLFGDAGRMPADGESLIEKGIIDSTGILELIGFLESAFGIEIEDTETVPKNLDSMENLVRFVSGKMKK